MYAGYLGHATDDLWRWVAKLLLWGPGRGRGMAETREVIHHHYGNDDINTDALPSGEMDPKPFGKGYDSEDENPATKS